MKKLFLIMAFIQLIISCNNNNNKITSIVVENDRSNSIDLLRGIYRVNFINHKQKKFNIKFSAEKIKKLIDVYYDNEIANMRDTIQVVDSTLLIMPVTTTTFIIQFESRREQRIIIQEDSRYTPLNNKKFSKLKEFIEGAQDIIESNTEIKNNPKSDIHYF